MVALYQNVAFSVYEIVGAATPQLPVKTVAVEFDLLRECFFHDSSLCVVEDLLIWSPIGSVFRFRCDAKCSVKGDIELREDLAELGKQVFVTQDAIYYDFCPRPIGVSEMVNWEPAARQILVERKRTAFASGVHVIVRQKFVPWISFHAELEVAVPDVSGNLVLNLACRHVIIKFLPACNCVS